MFVSAWKDGRGPVVSRKLLSAVGGAIADESCAGEGLLELANGFHDGEQLVVLAVM